MTAVAERGLDAAPVTRTPRLRALRLPDRWVLASVAFTVANAIAFVIVRPGVNDLWAARARASAVSHGVGLTYWFSWFGGGATPGNYSVLTPYLSALITAELLGALSAVAITVVVASLVRRTPHANAATAIAAFGASVNLWSGRVPFLLGSALALLAFLGVLRGRRVLIAVASLLTVLTSPVSAAFLALALLAMAWRTQRLRRASLISLAVVVAGLGGVALAFGAPGPQNYSLLMCLEALGGLVLFLLARPPGTLRVVIVLSMVVAVAMVVVPNGMGSNFNRLVWFCLPVAVVALSRWRAAVAVLLVSPLLFAGANLTVSDLRQAGEPAAARAYYLPLGQELDRVPGLANYRVEVVTETAHAAYDALLQHAMLARGWETQEDNALNSTLKKPGLDATAYKVWLDNNSVAYVAFPRSRQENYPEYQLVATGALSYLHQIWSNGDWTLYRVADPLPIVAPPQSVVTFTQATMTVHSGCVCTFSVRIRYSKFLHGTPASGDGQASFLADDAGYTVMTTTRPGDYVLRGSVTSFLH